MEPTMTVSSEITMATIGRLMKNLDTSASRVRRLAGDDLNDRPVSYFHQALDDNAFSLLHAGGDDPEVADAVAHRDRTDRDFVIAAHDRDLLAALLLRDGALRDQQGARCRAYRKP